MLNSANLEIFRKNDKKIQGSFHVFQMEFQPRSNDKLNNPLVCDYLIVETIYFDLRLIECMETLENNKNSAMTFEQLIDRYSVLITKVCYYFSPNLSDFKDLRQDVLINIWKGWERFRNEAKLSTWIYRICFNTCITYQRKNKFRRNEIPVSEILEIPSYEGFELDRYKEMHKLINQLNPGDKAIILMWLDEKSYEDIAEVIGVNRNTLATRLKRIKERLVKLSNQ